MRILQILVFFVLLAVIGIFAVQNTSPVTLNFLSRQMSVTIALLVVSVYVLGMLSGWTVVAILRRSFRGIMERPPT